MEMTEPTKNDNVCIECPHCKGKGAQAIEDCEHCEGGVIEMEYDEWEQEQLDEKADRDHDDF